jgi:hypothetical protein
MDGIWQHGRQMDECCGWSCAMHDCVEFWDILDAQTIRDMLEAGSN